LLGLILEALTLPKLSNTTDPRSTKKKRRLLFTFTFAQPACFLELPHNQHFQLPNGDTLLSP
ncbi:MAG: hypothetical protein V4520_18830, partial [Bacteroidota bacterium]